MKPEKTIDYEVGFQQKLSNNSALKIQTYYREQRDMIRLRPYIYVPSVALDILLMVIWIMVL
ncbi:MAG: hypothetical protein R2771_02970 [Saprospiraceae bacterium]